MAPTTTTTSHVRSRLANEQFLAAKFPLSTANTNLPFPLHGRGRVVMSTKRRARILFKYNKQAVTQTSRSSTPVIATTHSTTKNTCAFHLPPTLVRPEMKVCAADLGEMDDSLRDVPRSYVRSKLADQGRSMLSVLANTCPKLLSASHSNLPKELEIVIADLVDTNDQLPTHVLALTSSSDRTRYTFFPTHGLVLAANCLRVPPAAFASSSEGGMTRPVVPISLADPSSFPLLHGYLYTHSISGLYTSLLSLPPSLLSSFTETEDQDWRTTYLAQACSPQVLAAMAKRIHGVWANAVCLGVEDEEMWDAIDRCWRLVTKALRLRMTHQQQAASEPEPASDSA